MGKTCIAFSMEDPKEAYGHMQLETVENYGDCAHGHGLHTWDDGERRLCRCISCGGYVLVQKSEFHGSSGDDSVYFDFFPVGSPEEADDLNRRFNGWDIETRYEGRYLMRTNGVVCWSRK